MAHACNAWMAKYLLAIRYTLTVLYIEATQGCSSTALRQLQWLLNTRLQLQLDLSHPLAITLTSTEQDLRNSRSEQLITQGCRQVSRACTKLESKASSISVLLASGGKGSRYLSPNRKEIRLLLLDRGASLAHLVELWS